MEIIKRILRILLIVATIVLLIVGTLTILVKIPMFPIRYIITGKSDTDWFFSHLEFLVDTSEKLDKKLN